MLSRRRESRGWCVSVVVFAGIVGGCGIAQSRARDAFSQSHTCPSERVIVTDLPPPAPPADIAADPERLLLWRDQIARHRWYHVEGCGVAVDLDCWDERDGYVCK